ncbi:MAG TPA: hypothetical protein VLZ06_01980 [Solirubrobacteraceae bacterium]|nr:hypothetical protein [Solirubrobacteraceae bacterium]
MSASDSRPTPPGPAAGADNVALLRSSMQVGAYERQEFAEWHGEDLGGGVVLALVTLEARMPGSPASVRERWAFTSRLRDARVVGVKADGDLERARAEAERLAGETTGAAGAKVARPRPRTS